LFEEISEKFQTTVDTIVQVCRMRISLEGVDTEQGRNFSGNRLKALKKTN